jgi:predicted Rossmann fold flavoprotein
MDTSTQVSYDAIIIGAGPAGMIAAITAAKRDRKVLLLEKMSSPGNKLLISGKGRCNLTNAGNIDKFLDRFSASGIFLRNAFAMFFNEDLCEFFRSAGCKLKTERGERVFPASSRSGDVLNTLKRLMEKNNVTIICNEEVKEVSLVGSKKCVLTQKGKSYIAEKVAVCTGGLSYPDTGSTGFGFRLAERLGHKIEPLRPGLVPVVTASGMPGRLSGLSLENVACSVVSGGEVIDSRFGDMLFTHFGLSGPIILDLSGVIYDLLQNGKKVFVSINLKPALDTKKLDARLRREFSSQPNKALKNILRGLLPSRLVDEFLIYCGIDPLKKANQVTKAQRKKLADSLFGMKLEIIKTKPIKDAIITRGGVSTNQINPKTMESRMVKGLYFAGEVIDVDAKTGGYNLQAAFSTGYVCGANL